LRRFDTRGVVARFSATYDPRVFRRRNSRGAIRVAAALSHRRRLHGNV